MKPHNRLFMAKAQLQRFSVETQGNPPRRGQRIKITVRVEQPGKTALFIEL
jgi:hypothetical protein